MGSFFITDLLRNIFFGLDKIVYWFIGVVYTIFMEIANTTMFSNEIFNEFENKVYALLGIFMLFKVSFSVLSYIVNPDEFTDKSKGMNKLITNILISLVLIIGVPIIFTQAMEIQQIILKDDVIPKLFSSAESQIYISSQDSDDGSDMALWAFSAFYSPESDFNSLSEIFRDDVNRRNANETDYAVEYHWFLSTVAGVVIVLLLISFCFDVALRSIKLGFLQMIAPIPIISRIDPKKGNEVFNKWVKNCISTYLDLFIRLAGIFFAIYIIKLIKQSGFTDVVTGESAVHTYSKLTFVFIIMGALMFAKQLPKLIKDITGFDMGGNFTLNPFKKLSQVPLVGAATSGLAAMAGGAIAGGIAGKEAGHIGRGAFQGAMGAAAGLKGKVSLGGDKNPGLVGAAFAGSQAGHKAITGKDYEVFNPLKRLGRATGESQVNELKDAKNRLLTQQAGLDADLQDLYKAYQVAAPEERENIMRDIQANRTKYGKIGKHISTLDDQISDIKRIYKFDDSKKGDVADALAASNQTYSSARRTSSSPNSTNPSSVSSNPINSGSSSTNSNPINSGSSSTNSSSTNSSSSSRSRSSSSGGNSVSRTSTNRSYGTSPSSSSTSMQQRVEQASNYHEAPTTEQHIRELYNQTEFWNRPDVVEAVNANEREVDRRNAQTNGNQQQGGNNNGRP